jgi:hypothetical protein
MPRRTSSRGSQFGAYHPPRLTLGTALPTEGRDPSKHHPRLVSWLDLNKNVLGTALLNRIFKSLSLSLSLHPSLFLSLSLSLHPSLFLALSVDPKVLRPTFIKGPGKHGPVSHGPRILFSTQHEPAAFGLPMDLVLPRGDAHLLVFEEETYSTNLKEVDLFFL